MVGTRTYLDLQYLVHPSVPYHFSPALLLQSSVPVNPNLILLRSLDRGPVPVHRVNLGSGLLWDLERIEVALDGESPTFFNDTISRWAGKPEVGAQASRSWKRQSNICKKNGKKHQWIFFCRLSRFYQQDPLQWKDCYFLTDIRHNCGTRLDFQI